MPKRIGHYNVLSELGSGGMAVVYKAEQPSLDRLVAIKELDPDLAKDKSIATRFEREGKSVASLAHQNIVHVYDFLSRASSMYIVMEYVEGVDVFELLERVERIPPEIAAIIALQAARALEYAHYRGVVHRDFKPSNLMITKLGEVKLMDFGIARDESFDDLTRPGTALGTPAYMSPEQIMGQKVDGRSDVFSFGIVLYQMLTGQKPFRDDETHSVLQGILNEPYRRPRSLYPDIPWKLQRIIAKCLKKAPGKRYQSAEALRKDLERWVSKKVAINYNGRLVIYLRNRGMLSDLEAKTYVREKDLKSVTARTVDSGMVRARDVVFKPVLSFAVICLFLFGGWITTAKQMGLSSLSGKVFIHANPWAKVVIDGKEFTTTPTMEPANLAPGRHVLEFYHPKYGKKTIRQEVISGEEHRVVVNFP